ncbi:MAG: hypothetical protein WAQ05_01785 [Rubrivivax sp.]
MSVVMSRSFVTGGLLLAGLWTAGTAAAQATDAQRISAAKRTVATHPYCSTRTLGAYYWEIGDASGAMTSGAAAPRGDTAVGADTVIGVASASKWIYAAYTVQKYGDEPSARPYLNLTSGYSNFRTSDCPTAGTVAQCLPGARSRSEALNQVFHYDGGHMQQHAINMGLGPLYNGELAVEIGSMVGTAVVLSYVQPGLAGGVSTTARSYGGFLRSLMAGSATPLALGSMLGSNPVCTFPSASCNASRLTAMPEAWHYSLGHWIEDDPATTPAINIAYSSPGTFGFYPWIDASRSYYGILARQTEAFSGNDEGYASAKCGRVVRMAWMTGVAQ